MEMRHSLAHGRTQGLCFLKDGEGGKVGLIHT